MSFTNAGTIRPSIHETYVKALGCRNTTFVVPKDTNTLCRLVELIVRPNTVVVELGCGDGIPTIHAAACGARRVPGVEINPLAVANTRTNTARVILPAGTLDVVQIDMLEFLGNGSIRDEVFARLGLLDDTVDLVFSNPPYVPIRADLAPRPGSDYVPARSPATDRGLLGAPDTLVERIVATRSAMMAAEDGGPDGLRFIREAHDLRTAVRQPVGLAARIVFFAIDRARQPAAIGMDHRASRRVRRPLWQIRDGARHAAVGTPERPA